jgi:hypothetical protein
MFSLEYEAIARKTWIYKKVKKNVYEILSPNSVDKPVNKVFLSCKCRAFLYLQDVFA